MHEATRTLNYDGTFVYQRGEQLDGMRLIHRFDNEVESERLISLSGPPREVIRNGAAVTCLFADSDGAKLDKNPPRDIIGIGFSAPVEKLASSYAFAIVGSDRVASRTATVIAITPHDRDRYSYKLWLDEQSNLVLKSIILNSAGHTLEQVQFTQFAVVEQLAEDLLLPGFKGTHFDWQTEAGSSAAKPPLAADFAWKVGWLPTGFEFKESNTQPMSNGTPPAAHLVFSDGLAMVSVFVEAIGDNALALRGHSSRGAVNAMSRLADPHHQITVVGEVPLGTVEKIAKSVAKFDR